ncbi:stress induced DNA binding protein [Lacticaseibacillus thailandensis DSM 22698 = JCM 13996]|uniref:Stress induced DNA binding protein n=2 Tax=Lacticaseibacillus thailandensis TaxID=381741 RepID=A0A0R2C4F7_9LACO|nr:stress induced DNA binding protein [Lacticaseibacillus thailandensis DSM 22698 = JCM 13996]
MINHILSNHVILTNKLRQATWFIRGVAAPQLATALRTTNQENSTWIDRVADALLDEGEIPANLMSEYASWTMLKEDGAQKYRDTDTIINGLVHDWDTDNLFVTRAIALANQEERPALAATMTALYGWNRHQIRLYQAVLGHAARTGLDDEDDDDDAF